MSSNLSLFNVLKIITEIKTNPHQTPEELYSSFGISKSGFYKYKQRLEEEMGFEFHYDRRQKCFIIDNEPFIPTINLSLGELSALVMSMGQFYATGGDYIITYRALKAVQKLVANCCPEKKIRRQLEEMFDETLYNRGYGCKEDILATIEHALESRQILKIHYFSHTEGMREIIHEIEPYMIFFKRRALYMDAHCRTHWGQIRIYRLNRIRKAEILPQTGFEIREDYSFKQRHQHAFSIYTGEIPTKVRIRFSRSKAPYIKEVLWHPSQKITPDPDHPGSILFEVSVSYPKEVIWWMRQWESDAEVLEPQEMREYMLEMARREVDMYSR
jgi:predicted DNA-binding transcriptional regulator YafY